MILLSALVKDKLKKEIQELMVITATYGIESEECNNKANSIFLLISTDIKRDLTDTEKSNIMLWYGPQAKELVTPLNLAEKEKIKDICEKYKKGGCGYGESKKLLLNKILEHFSEARENYKKIYPKKDYVYGILEEGAKKAKKVATKTLEEAKKRIGYL